jgi:hypothetical protein
MSIGVVFWPETAEPLAHYVLEHGRGAALVSFFKFFLSQGNGPIRHVETCPVLVSQI